MQLSFRKAVSLLLCLAMTLGCLGVLPATAAVSMTTKNGVLDVEAEAVSYDKTALSLASDNMFSGGKGLSVNKEDKTVPPKDAAAHLDLSFTADKAGTYSIWLRHTAEVENKSGQNFFMAVNGGDYTIVQLTAAPQAPAWVKAGTVTVAADGGKAEVKIRTRQQYSIVFDRFIITNDAAYVPDDGSLKIGSATPKPTATAAPKPVGTIATFETKDGSALFEAEKATIVSTFTVKEDAEMSGGKGVNTNVNASAPPKADATPELAFNVKADKAGKYTLWMRIRPTTVNKSFYLSINGGNYNSKPIGGVANEFNWFKAEAVTVANAGDVTAFRIVTNGGWFDIDNILLTTQIGKPEGKDGKISSTASGLPQNLYPKPSFTPPPEHPRLMLNKSKIPAILANMDQPQNEEAKKRYQANLAKKLDGTLKPPANADGNYSGTVLGIIESYAFAYVLGTGEDYGKQALQAMRDYLGTLSLRPAGSITYNVEGGQVIFSTAQVYDWCYPLLTKEDKDNFIAQMETIAEGMTIGYPPTRQGSLTSWGSEGQLLWDQNAMAIATYNERADIYNVVAGRFFAEYVPARKFFYSAHLYHQGSSYTDYRFKSDTLATYLYDAMGLPNVFGPDQQYVPYWGLYGRRPDGQILRDGDNGNDKIPTGTYASGPVRIDLNIANYYKDPYLKQAALRISPTLSGLGAAPDSMSAVEFLICNDPSLTGAPLEELPQTKYFPAPIGEMIARTGWHDGFNSPDVLAQMKVNEYFFANHAHLDAGHFQLYYKGILAKDSGYYQGAQNTTEIGGTAYGSEHDYKYQKRSVAHNTILVYDPKENMTYNGVNFNDGGQQAPKGGAEPMSMDNLLNEGYKVSEILGHEFGSDPYKPDYTYLKGDITKAYSAKMKDFERSFMFFDFKNNEHPAAMVIFDRVTSADASFKKSWLLHGMYEPEIAGNRTTFKNDQNGYNGKLVVDTLLPKADNTVIEKIGGADKEFWVNGQNFPGIPVKGGSNEGGGWRIEVSPKTPSAYDPFLHVLQVSDADTTLQPLDAQLIESEQVLGAQIYDRVVTFSKNKGRIENNIGFSFTGEGVFKITVADAKEGTWTVSRDGTALGEYSATADGGVLVFEGAAGSYSLQYKNASVNRPEIKGEKPQSEGISIRVDGKFIYTDVAPTIQQDRTLVPMRAIFESLGVAVAWDESTQTATATKDGRTVTITENSTIATIDGKEKVLDVPAQVVNGRFLVPVRFVSESFGATVTWYGLANMVDIKAGKVYSQLPASGAGYATILKATCSSFFEEQDAPYSCDGDPATLWSAEGEQWINYELDKEYTVKAAEAWLNPNSGRSAVFDFWTSTDGQNWTKVLDCKGSPKNPDDWELFSFATPAKTKYIRYYAHGSDKSMWNGLKEIRFIVQ